MVCLSITEAKDTAGVMCTQDMLHITWVIELFVLDVKNWMVLKMENKEFVDLAKNWIVEGHTRHVDVQSRFL